MSRYVKKIVMGWITCRMLQFVLKENKLRQLVKCFSKISAIMVIRKIEITDFFCLETQFLSYFLPKTSRKHHKHCLNPMSRHDTLIKS
jgi:hypothetical protein